MPISDLPTLISSMNPVLNDGVYYFATLTKNIPPTDIIASIYEQEGLSVVISEQTAKQHNLATQFKSAWITLNVHSDLSAIGLTATFAKALSDVGISCNVVAGNHHDHIFVPFDKKELAIQTLLALQQSANSSKHLV